MAGAYSGKGEKSGNLQGERSSKNWSLGKPHCRRKDEEWRHQAKIKRPGPAARGRKQGLAILKRKTSKSQKEKDDIKESGGMTKARHHCVAGRPGGVAVEAITGNAIP